MFILFLSSVIVWRLLSRASSTWHFMTTPCVHQENSLRWKVAGVCSRMLLTYNEMVNVHGIGVCLGGEEGGEEQQHLLLLHWLLCQGKILLLYTSLNQHSNNLFFVALTTMVIFHLFMELFNIYSVAYRAECSEDPLIPCQLLEVGW